MSFQIISVGFLLWIHLMGSKAYRWTPSTNVLPENAVSGGFDHDSLPLYVARAEHEGLWHVGKALPHYTFAYIPWDGLEIRKSVWEYLVGDCFNWVRSYDGHVPRNAVINGRNGVPEYVGRQYVGTSLAPGRLIPSHKGVYIPFWGKEHFFDKYEVLVEC